MKYSYNWLKELSKTKKTPAQLAELLTMRSFELDGIKTERKETQLEFSILPNRAHDALSHIGMAREICAIEQRTFRESKARNIKAIPGLNAKIKEERLCQRYTGAIIENIQVFPAPKWMQERLLVCGIKPINNVVDITNYVMLETGQPLHSFDLNKIEREIRNPKSEILNKSKLPITNYQLQIIVRKARKGEKIILLDEKEYELNENDLVIADSTKPIALAGVMGGLNSSVTATTESIVLESANFHSTNIRKTRTRHNIITESSFRFERSIDPNLAEIGMARAIELLKKYGGRNVLVTASAEIYPKKIKPWIVRLDIEYVNKLLGEDMPIKRIKFILENLGLSVLGSSASKLTVEVPTRRIDIKTQEDLIEEIGRIYGYENIKEQALRVDVKVPSRNIKRDFENELRNIMVGMGFSEMMTYSFYGDSDVNDCRLDIKNHVEIDNPLSVDQKYLRWSLVPNILKSMKLNLKHQPNISIFEIGNKFHEYMRKPQEATVLVGAKALEKNDNNLFYELKGNVEAMLSSLGYLNVKFNDAGKNLIFWHQSRSADILTDEIEIGRIGEINPAVLRNYGIKTRVAIFGIRISELLKFGLPQKNEFRQIGKFPHVARDISMFVGLDAKYAEIVANIQKNGGKLIKNVGLFDKFEKEGKRSLALRLEISSDSKTLTAEEIDAVMKKIISNLEKELKVKVRKK